MALVDGTKVIKRKIRAIRKSQSENGDMSWTDEEIDDLFRDGASNQSFEYDNSYFSEIEAALPVNGKGKDFLWLGTALVFVAVLTTGYLVNNANNTSFDTTEQLANLDLNTEDTNTEMNSNDRSAETSAQDQNTSNNNVELTDLSNELSNPESSVANTQFTASINANANQSSSINDASAQNGQNGPLTSMYDLATRNVSAKSKNNVDAANSTLAVSIIGQNVTQESGNENLSQLRNDAEASSEKQFIRETSPITASLTLNGVSQLDQGLNKNVAPHSIPPVLGELRPKATLYFELNAGISQSLITPSEYTSKSFGGGLGVETHLGNFNLTTGVNFKASYHNDLFLSRKGKVYGFGSQLGVNTYDIRKIYSIEMPIMLGYNVKGHNFNFGVRPSLVVGSQTVHQAFENQTLLRTEEMNGLIEANVDGEYLPALMRFGVKPVVGYAYRFNQWTVGANVGVQLMQSVNEEVMDGFNNQLPIDGQIYLRRTIRLRR
jgi:hypothetical protein